MFAYDHDKLKDCYMLVYGAEKVLLGEKLPQKGTFNVWSATRKANMVVIYMHMQMSEFTYINVYFLFLSPNTMHISSHAMFYIPNTFMCQH